MQTANGIKAYWRETFKRWWNYRGLWRESLDDQPSAAFVYRGLLISFICLFVLLVYVSSYYYEYVNGIYQTNPTFIFFSIEEWIITTFWFIYFLVVYGTLWNWGKTKNSRHIISGFMYLMLFSIGLLAAHNVGSLYKIFEIRELVLLLYKAYGTWGNLYIYLMIPTLLLPPILLMWIQGWRQALIFSPIFVFPCYIIMWLASGDPEMFFNW